ncbi:MAG: glycosyltransferase family 2 protein [Elainellaceae cyanobacterium]
MSYAIHDLEVTQPLREIQLSPTETGIALIIRRHDRPVGFLMNAVSSGTIVTPDDLKQWIGKEVGAKLLQEQIRDELAVRPSTDELPSFTVAICTKDRPDNLSRCLQSLIALQLSHENPEQKGDRQDLPRFEILVVDNAPSDQRTHNLITGLPTVRYVQEPKPGLDFARNTALHHARGELLAYLDDDVVVDRHWFDGLQDAWAENPDAGAFTGLVLPYELETEAQILFEQRGGFRRGFEKIRYGQCLPGNPLHPCGAGIFGAGCNMTFRRDVLLKLGGFDDALDTGAPLPGGGDLDIFYRVIRAGYHLVYEPHYLVFHQHRRELYKLRRQYWTWGLGFMAFVAKSWQSDPPQRSQFRRLIRWWFNDQLKQINQRLKNRHPLPLGMILAELSGGIVGLMGEYPRSLKRIEQIRRQHS